MTTIRVPLSQLICILIVLVLFSEPSNAHAHDPDQAPVEASATGGETTNFVDAARKFLLEGDTDTIGRRADDLIKSVPYFRASIPMRIFECISRQPMLRCTKLFVLQKMEEHKGRPSSGNVTRDFLDQVFGAEEHMGSLIDGKLADLSETELNKRLVLNFQRFFKHRDIKLHFLPGLMVKIVPSRENKLQFSLKKMTKLEETRSGRSRKRKDDESIEDNTSIGESDAEENSKKGGGLGGGGHKKKKKQSVKQTILQMAVPVMVMPAILMGTFLPFWLPVLKMATFMTMMMNNSAFIAALIYAARTHANSQDEPQHINYGHQGYH